MSEADKEVVIIGSGFGGSVSALRLAEKGWKVTVLEQGRRLTPGDLEAAGTSARQLAWAPALGLKGFFSQDVFRHLAVVRGVGVGGGSLVYAAVLLEPRDNFFRDPAWVSLSPDWQAELAPHYARARKMLGVTPNPMHGIQDDWLRSAAERMDCEDTFGTVPQGIYFGDDQADNPDPFFQGKGPVRRGCNACGRCITGCAQGAKNSLDYNYLYLAEQQGVEILPERKVTHIEPHPDGGYLIHQKHPWDRRVRYQPMHARKVILSAGALGTLEILFASRDRYGTLPELPPSLGQHVRTNSEAIVGILASNPDADVTEGATISSHFYPDEHTHITQNRFPESYNFMKWYMGPLVDGGRPLHRALRTLWQLLRHPWTSTASWRARHWFKRISVLTVMQHAPGEMSFDYGRTLLRAGRHGLRSRMPDGGLLQAYIPQANRAARAFAQASDGVPLNTLMESIGNQSVTAHILGGVVMAESPEQGVIDRNHEVFGYADLFVVDGSAIPANVGVNPSLTITALAERFGSNFPARSD